MIDRAVVDKILEVARIEQVIGEYVPLKRRGANYMACCPFHNEKTPSFSVSPAKGIYKCFGCGKSGNAINFIMEHEQFTYVEAVRHLAKKYNITIEEKEESPEQQQQRMRHESMLILNEYARDYYVNVLWNDPFGRSAGLGYFRERGLTDQTIRTFQLGFALPTKNAFTNKALQDGYKEELLADLGLTIPHEDEASGRKWLNDRFFDRIMFPFHSLSGRVMGFGGRIMVKDKNLAKYMNSPESDIFPKRKTLYGIYFSKQAITRLQKCYLVEGYFDVLSLWQAGVQNVVASSGTSLTVDQVRLIHRFTPRVTVLYDGDAAGIHASIRGIDMLLEEGLQVRVVRFPEGDDPDSFVRSHSAQETIDFLNNSEQDFIMFKIALMEDDVKSDPLRRSELIKEVIHSISVIPDPVTRAVYVQEACSRLNISEDLLSKDIVYSRNKYIEDKQRLAANSAAVASMASATNSPDVAVAQGSDAQSGTSANIKSVSMEPSKSDPCFVAERELIYYLLKFGQIDLEEKQEGVARFRVCDLIKRELEEDDLLLQSEVYAKIFLEYFSLDNESDKESDEERQRFFINHIEPSVAKASLDLLSEDQPLTIKRYIESIPPEEFNIESKVMKSIVVFKSAVTTKMCEDLSAKLKTPNLPLEEMKEIMQQLALLTKIRNNFARQLNRLT